MMACRVYQTIQRRMMAMTSTPTTQPTSKPHRTKSVKSFVDRRKMNAHFKSILNELDCKRQALAEPRREFVQRTRECLSSGFSLGSSDDGDGGVELVEYGSTITNFSLPSSDVDLCLQYHKLLKQQNDSQSVQDLCQRIAKCLDGKHGMKVVEVIDNARVPLVRYEHAASGISGDITLNNIAVYYNSLLLKSYSQIDDRICNLVQLVKLWAKNRGIAGARQLTLCSYGYTLLVIHFLVSRASHIPNLQKIYDGDRKTITIPSRLDGTQSQVTLDVSFETDEEKLRSFLLRSNFSLVDMFRGFLTFAFEEFDPKENLISVHQTGKIPKSSFSSLSTASTESLVKRRMGSASNTLIIQDPIENYRNIATSVSPSGWKYMRACGKHSLNLLQNGYSPL